MELSGINARPIFTFFLLAWLLKKKIFFLQLTVASLATGQALLPLCVSVYEGRLVFNPCLDRPTGGFWMLPTRDGEMNYNGSRPDAACMSAYNTYIHVYRKVLPHGPI